MSQDYLVFKAYVQLTTSTLKLGYYKLKMKKIIKLSVDDQNSNKRLDIFISSKITDISRTRIKNLILDGFVKINDKIIYEPSKKINLKNDITIEIPPPKKTFIKPYDYDLEIIFDIINLWAASFNWIERSASDREVVGSSPSWPTIKKK